MRGAADQTAATTKANANDFVTIADIKSQNLLRDRLSKAFPGELIVSEEDSVEQQAFLQDPSFTGFVLDPIDGTYNFRRGMKESAISVGYIEDGESVAGVIFDVYKDETLEAKRGKPTLLNGKKVRVSDQKELSGASVATSNGYDYEAAKRNLERQIAIFEQSGTMPWISCPGSAVLTMGWIACGRIDAIHHTGFKPYDNAAAFVILREAGARVHKLDGGEAGFTDDKLLVGTPAIVDQLHEIFAKLPPELLS